MILQETIVRVKAGFRIISHTTGKNLGTFKTRAQAQRRLAQLARFRESRELVEDNPYHEPAGSPKGGEFAHAPGGSGGGDKPSPSKKWDDNPGARGSGLIAPSGEYFDAGTSIGGHNIIARALGLRSANRAVEEHGYVRFWNHASSVDLDFDGTNLKAVQLAERHLKRAYDKDETEQIQLDVWINGRNEGDRFSNLRDALIYLDHLKTRKPLEESDLSEAPDDPNDSPFDTPDTPFVQPSPFDPFPAVSRNFFNRIPEAQVGNFLSTPLGGARYAQSFADLGTGLLTRLRNILTTGLIQGQGVTKVAKAVQDALGNAKYQAERIVRSEFVRTAALADQQIYGANQDKLDGVQWTSALDERVCAFCGSLDGQVWENPDDAPTPVDDTHPNCFVPDTKVSGSFLVGVRFVYSGRIVTIKTLNGHTLRVTPNHPILTTRGMVPAQTLREGNYVISRLFRIDDEDNQHMPTVIEKVFSSLADNGFRQPARLSQENFHGDAVGGQGEVDVVALDRELLDNVVTAFAENRSDLSFKFAHEFERTHLDASLFDQLSQRPLDSQDGRMSGSSLSGALRVSHAGPFQCLSFGSSTEIDTGLAETILQRNAPNPGLVTETFQRRPRAIPLNEIGKIDPAIYETPPNDGNPGFMKPVVNHMLADADFSRDLCNRLPGFIAPDQIVEITDSHFDGHVYDLQSTTGFLIAENILVSNCRCKLVPVVKNGEDLGFGPASRASMNGQVPATTTYEEWLADQDEATQKEILGPTRFKLYSSGQAELGDFVTAHGVKSVKDVLRDFGRNTHYDPNLGESQELTEDNPYHEPAGSSKGGEFAHAPGGGIATLTHTSEKVLLDRLRAPDGGFTYSPTTNTEPTQGFAVSPYPERSKVFTADSLTEDDLLTYVVTNWDVLSQPDHYLGAWHDPATGKVYLDVSVVKANEAEANALALAKDQIAYFDLVNMKSVDVNRQAKSGQR